MGLTCEQWAYWCPCQGANAGTTFPEHLACGRLCAGHPCQLLELTPSASPMHRPDMDEAPVQVWILCPVPKCQGSFAQNPSVRRHRASKVTTPTICLNILLSFQAAPLSCPVSSDNLVCDSSCSILYSVQGLGQASWPLCASVSSSIRWNLY